MAINFQNRKNLIRKCFHPESRWKTGLTEVMFMTGLPLTTGFIFRLQEENTMVWNMRFIYPDAVCIARTLPAPTFALGGRLSGK
jgi:hypothetical protein